MTIINIYAPNRGAARHTSHLLTRIKRHIDKNTLIVEDLNTPLSATDRSPKQKINKETYNLPRLNHEEIENLNRPMMSKEVESVIHCTQKSPGSDVFIGEVY